MEIISAAYAEAHFDQFIDAARRGPVVVTKKNRPAGVFFSIDDIRDTIWPKKPRKLTKRAISQLRKAQLA